MLTRMFRKKHLQPVGAALAASSSVPVRKSQNLAAKAAPTGFGGICEISGLTHGVGPLAIAALSGLLLVSGACADEAGNAVASAPAPAAQPLPSRATVNGVKMRPPELPSAALAGTILKFDNADIYEVLQAVLGEMLHLNYIVDPSIQGKVTINTQGSVSQADLFTLLESVLSLNNLSILRDGKVYKVVKDANAPRDTLTFEALGEGSPLIQIIPVKFVQASALVNTLRNFVGPQAGIVNDPTNRYLVVADRAANVAKLLDMVKVLDVDYLQHVKIKLVQIEKGDAKEMAKEMETLFKASGMFNWPGTEANKIFFMPIMRMNALLVAASNDAVLDAAEKWIRALDDEPRDGVGTSIHVHSIQNSTAVRVANVLRQIYGGAPIAQSGGSGLSSDPTKVVLKGNVPTSGVGMTGSVQIIPDETTNVLVIKASPQDYLQIKKIIERIDIIPRQVLIQVMVAEITLNDETKFGIEWWLKGGKLGINGTRYPTQTALDTGMTSVGAAAKLVDNTFAPGLNYLVFNGVGDVVGMINALAQTTDVNILSSPHIMASDGREAKIEVGRDVPIITQTVSMPGSTATTTGLTTSNSVQYRTVGILLSVKPHINASGLVSLALTQEVSDVADVASGGIQSPQFSKRKVETEVTLEEGKTLMIAGLIQDNSNQTSKGLPGFKDIPVLGYLFGAKGNKRDKTELMVTITPYVVRNREEGERVTAAFRDSMAGLKKLMSRDDRENREGAEVPGND